jgi:hypothetical protein
MMLKQVRSVGLVCAMVACLSMLGGCRFFPSFGSRSSYGSGGGGGVGSTTSDLIVENGHQSGDMGDIEGYSASTFQEQGYTSDGYTQVRLDSQGEGWWVMASITISGADLDELEPDIVYATETSGVYDGETDEGPSVNLVGCSGPTFGNYTYDTSAQRTELEVQDLGDGSRRVFYRAWFAPSDGGDLQLAEGSFDYRRTVN